jgi:tRNA(fMet)-specific endonuclease VapC
MAVRFLLDTNTVSYILKGTYPNIRARLVRVPIPEVGISVITEAELRFGLERHPGHKLRLVVEEFLRRVEILVWDSSAAGFYAKIRASLEDRGKPMGNLDLMIAAQALAADAVLVTNDAVFRRVRGLKIEDWSKSS